MDHEHPGTDKLECEACTMELNRFALFFRNAFLNTHHNTCFSIEESVTVVMAALLQSSIPEGLTREQLDKIVDAVWELAKNAHEQRSKEMREALS